MATTSRTGLTILGLAGVAVLSVGGTVLAAGGAHRHDDSDSHTPMGGSRMGMMGGSMMGGDGAGADHDPTMGMMGGSMMGAGGSVEHDSIMDCSMMGMMGGSMMGGSMMGDDDAWTDHDPMMDASEMPSWMWEHMSQHMGVSAREAEPEAEAAEGPASDTSDETEPAG